MPAVAFHFSGKTVSRSEGRSAIAHVAYITAQNLHDERLDLAANYGRKRGVELVWHAAPKAAPAWAHEIGTAWNAVEAVETRKNATLALDYTAAFPHQLDATQRAFIVKDFLREAFTRRGFMATAAVHEPGAEGDVRNHHAHIMFSYRGLDADGWAHNKDRRFSSYATRTEALLELKEKWAELGARQLERMGLVEEAQRWRQGYQTLPEQRAAALERGDLAYAAACDREPTRHVGVAANGMERKGQTSERGDINRAIEARNAARDELAKLAQRQRHIDRHLTRLEALELAQMQQQADTQSKEAAPRGTTQYALDKLADLAAAQGGLSSLDDGQGAARLAEERARDEAWQRAILDEQQRQELEQEQEQRQRR